MFGKMYDKIAERAAGKVYMKLTDTFPPRPRRKESTVKQLLANPDDFVLTMWTEGDEVRIKLKKKEIVDDERGFEPPHARVRCKEAWCQEDRVCQDTGKEAP